MRDVPRFGILVVAALVTVGLGEAASYGDVLSTFDSDNEGWTVVGVDPTAHAENIVGGGAANWDEHNGQPPGSIRVNDDFTWTWARAPEAYRGDFLDSYGESFTYDIMIRISDRTPYPAMALVGSTMTLYYTLPSPPLDTWVTHEIPLSESGWRVNHHEQGPPASQGDVFAVLADLRDVLVLTEWNTGTDDTSLDNIRLPGEGGFTLSIRGECPGPMTFNVTGATPNRAVAFIYAFGRGSVRIPPGNSCAGVELGLNQTAQLGASTLSDGNGEVSLRRTIPIGACNAVFVQALDVASCVTSNVESI